MINSYLLRLIVCAILMLLSAPVRRAIADDNLDDMISRYLAQYRGGQYDEAARLSRRAIEAAAALQPQMDRRVLVSLRIDQAEIFKAAGQFDAAERALRDALSDIEPTADPGHAAASVALFELADVLRLEKKLDEAQDTYRKATGLNSANPSLRGAFEGRGPQLMRLDGAMVNSVFDFLERNIREPSDFGLYTYVLFTAHGPSDIDRAHALVARVLETTRNENKIEFDRRKLNIFLLPVDDQSQVGARELATNARSTAAEKADPLVDSYYNFDYAVEIINKFCSSKASRPKICKTDLSKGPYMITLANALAAFDIQPNPYLVVDLSEISPSSFGIYLSALKEQLKRPDFSNSQRVGELRLNAVNYINLAGDSLIAGLPSIERVLELVGLKESETIPHSH